MKNTESEKSSSKMWYVDYQFGFPARITEHPTNHGSQFINELSALVVKFNDDLWTHSWVINKKMAFDRNLSIFKDLFNPYKLN